MKHLRLTLALFLLAGSFSLLLSEPKAEALSCIQPPETKEFIELSDIVVVAQVVDSHVDDDKLERTHKLDVKYNVKGELPKTVTVYENYTWGPYKDYDPKELRVISLSKNETKYVMSLCLWDREWTPQLEKEVEAAGYKLTEAEEAKLPQENSSHDNDSSTLIKASLLGLGLGALVLALMLIIRRK